MSPAAVALQFPALDSADAEWGEECEEVAAGSAVSEKACRLEALKNGLRIGQPDGSPTSLDVLKAEVAMVVAGGRGAGPAWPTGIGQLDKALGGGVPRGRVTEVVGPLGAGKTSLVRQLVARVLAEGGWVAWVDATRTLAPADLAGLGERLIVVRPHDHTRGAWCADLLLRSGVFALVVLDGAPVLSRTVGVRLSQLARERDAAFVVLREGTQGSRLGGAVRLQIKPIQHARSLPATALSINGLSANSLSSNAVLLNAASSNTVPLHAVSLNAVSLHAVSPNAVSPNAVSLDTASLNAVSRNGSSANSLSSNAVSLHALSLNAAHSKPPTAHTKSQWRERRPPDRKFSVLVEKGGSYQTIEVTCAIVVARRVCADTEIPDRRGVARGARTAHGVEQKSVQLAERESTERQSVEVCESVSAIGVVSKSVTTYGHTVDASVVRQYGDDASWKKGRGRPRMAESSYGRTTRRGKARKFLSNREHAQKHDGDYERKQPVAESNSSNSKHTQQPNRQQERRESRRQSRHVLKQYAGSLG